MNSLRIFLADDHSVVLEGLSSLIRAEPDMQIVGLASDAARAVADALELRPDVAVIDVSMPGGGGIEVMRRLSQELPETRVLALTVHEDKGYLRRALDAGARGYILKRAVPSELIFAIRTVAAGGTYVDRALAAPYPVAQSGPEPRTATVKLSQREDEVMRLIAQGFSNKEAAARLAVSIKTVETYKARSLEKLGLKNRVDIVRYAAARGWLDDLVATDVS